MNRITNGFTKKLAAAMVVMFCLAGIANAQSVGIDITGATSVADIQSSINTALSNNTTVTVTGSFTNTNHDRLDLNIPANKKVIWDAEYKGTIDILNPNTISTHGIIRITGEGTFEVTENGYIENIGSATATGADGKRLAGIALSIAEAATLTMNDGTIKANVAYTILANQNAIVNINGGLVENVNAVYAITTEGNIIITINGGEVKSKGGSTVGAGILVQGNSAIVLNNGTISGGTYSGVTVQGNGVAYVTGSGTIGGIIACNSATAKAYYVGDNAAKFQTSGLASWTTSGTTQNLFRLDTAPALTTTSGAYVRDPSIPHVGAVTATFLTGLTITGVTSSQSGATHTFSGNTVTFAGKYNFASFTLTITGTLAGGKIPVTFTSANIGMNIEPPPPTITSANTATRTFGATTGFQVTASSITPVTYSLSGDVPSGVTINSLDGVITIASTVPIGVYTFTITANNGASTTATQSFTLTIAEFTVPSTGLSYLTSSTWLMIIFGLLSAGLWGYVILRCREIKV